MLAIMDKIRDVMDKMLDVLYPRRCVLCGDAGHHDMDICAPCLGDLKQNRAACQQCGEPIKLVTENLICGQCQKKPPPIDQTVSVFLYAQPLEWVITQMKFTPRLSYAHLLGDVMANALCDQKPEIPDVVVPVPLHHKRFAERGFNQSQVLAQSVCNKLNLKLDSTLIKKVVHTRQQSGLDAKQRRKNIKGAFELTEKINFKYVVLLDDVMSTGSTVYEVARVLKRAGVSRVDAWVLARAEGRK